MSKLLFVLAIQVVLSQDIIDRRNDNCTHTRDDIMYESAYFGWPHTISCSSIWHEIALLSWHEDAFYADDIEIECQIFDGSANILFRHNISLTSLLYDDEDNPGLELPPLDEKDNVDFVVTLVSISKDDCSSVRLHLNLTTLQPITCQQFINVSDMITVSTYVQEKLILSCDANQLSMVRDYENMEYEWLRNCSRMDENYTSSTKNEIIFNAIGFGDGGVYTCSVTYNGMIKYTTLLSVCVRYPLAKTFPSLKCSQPVLYAREGEDASLGCTASFGHGSMTSSRFQLKWVKFGESGSIVGEYYCTNSPHPRRIMCIYEMRKNCFYREPSRDFVEAVVEVKLIIANITTSDFSEYRVLLTTLDHDQPINASVALRTSIAPSLITSAMIVGICFAAVTFLLLLIIICFCNLVYIRVLYKRYFGHVFLDEKRHDALLAYSFSNLDNKFDQSEVKECISDIKKSLQSMGFKVLDDGQDGLNGQARGKHISDLMRESHRVVVFLTWGFIKDEWSMLTLHQGFQEIIESGSKLIFILLPGIKEYLKQHSKDDDTCRMIQRALKINYSMHWPCKGALKRKRFKFVLEDAMRSFN